MKIIPLTAVLLFLGYGQARDSKCNSGEIADDNGICIEPRYIQGCHQYSSAITCGKCEYSTHCLSQNTKRPSRACANTLRKLESPAASRKTVENALSAMLDSKLLRVEPANKTLLSAASRKMKMDHSASTAPQVLHDKFRIFFIRWQVRAWHQRVREVPKLNFARHLLFLQEVLQPRQQRLPQEQNFGLRVRNQSSVREVL